MSDRLLKKVHLLRERASALAAAERQYAWTHLLWVPRPARTALHLGLFEQPGADAMEKHDTARGAAPAPAPAH